MKNLIILLIIQFNVILLFAQNKSIYFKEGVSDKEIISNLPKRSVTESSNYIELEYSFDNAEITTIEKNAAVFQLLNIQGMSKMNSVGKPALPCYNDILAVPSKRGLGIKIVEATYQDFKGFYIAPAVEPQIDSGKDSLIDFTLNDSIYKKNSFYPENIAKIVSVQDYREAPIAFVQIRPVQFNPETKTVRCYSKIKYQVTFPSNLRPQISSALKKGDFDILKNVISNTTITTESTLSSKLKSASLIKTSKNYIIITTNAFLDAAKEFADWKTMLGFGCEIVSQPSWTSAEVKTVINQRYTSWPTKPEYFVIIGDHENVPGEVKYRPNYGNYTTDLYYACMGGVDDYTADMVRGRISVSSSDQAFTVIRKIINYERNPVTNSSFYSNGLNCAFFEDALHDGTPIDGIEDNGFTYSSELIRDYMMSKGYTVNRVYSTMPSVNPKFYSSTVGNGQAIPSELRHDISPYYPWSGDNSNITSEINAGKFYVLYRGHGLEDKWGNPLYTLTDIDNLNNGNKLPVVFSITCSTGGFLQTECFAEKLLRRSNGGAAGIFAASQVSYNEWNSTLAIGMFDAIWSSPGLLPSFLIGHNQYSNLTPHSDIYQMGKVLNQGLLRMQQTWEVSRYQNEIYHYFGDPTMEMYTAVPSSFSGVTVTDNVTSVTVNAAVSNCKITICSLLDMGATCYEVANDVSSYTFNDIVKPYYITVSKHNYKPYIYPQDLYIQNYAFTQYRLFEGININVGSNVTNSYSQGPVTIESGANVTLNADQNVLLANDFEVKLGSTFEVK